MGAHKPDSVSYQFNLIMANAMASNGCLTIVQFEKKKWLSMTFLLKMGEDLLRSGHRWAEMIDMSL